MICDDHDTYHLASCFDRFVHMLLELYHVVSHIFITCSVWMLIALLQSLVSVCRAGKLQRKRPQRKGHHGPWLGESSRAQPEIRDWMHLDAIFTSTFDRSIRMNC